MVAIDWLLQAGFILRGERTSIAIDPYLSDACEEIYGLMRRDPAPIRHDALGVEVVCISHWHEDHLDLPTVMAAVDAGALIIAPESCVVRIAGRGIDEGRLKAIRSGESITVGDATITAVPARHVVPGYLTEDAVGFLIRLDGSSIYHSGDTEYHRSLLAAAAQPIDVALLCINGTGGNMNAVEAAALAAQLRPRIVVPMHFGLWPDDGYGPGATLDPAEFAKLCNLLAPEIDVALPSTSNRLVIAGNADRS